jgi:hypothetical protein
MAWREAELDRRRMRIRAHRKGGYDKFGLSCHGHGPVEPASSIAGVPTTMEFAEFQDLSFYELKI